MARISYNTSSPNQLGGTVGWARAIEAGVGFFLVKRYLRSSLVLGVNEWVRGKGLGAVLPLTSHQCSIHCESSRVNLGASNRKWAPQTTGYTRKRGTKSEV